jgi:hypothetical protein
LGANLDGATLGLEPEGGTPSDISGWVDATESTPTRVVLVVPSPSSSPPGTAPAAGRYSVVVEGARVPLNIAPWVDPAPGPALSGSPLTVTGAGFLSGATDVTVGVTRIPGGSLTVDVTGTSILFSFSAPPGVAAGTVLPIRVSVNGVEADPALWVIV